MRLPTGAPETGWLCVLIAVAACSGKPQTATHEQQLAALGTIFTISASQATAPQFADALAELERYFLRIGVDGYPWHPGELAALEQGQALQQRPGRIAKGEV